MKKKIFTLLTLLVAIVTGAWADETYELYHNSTTVSTSVVNTNSYFSLKSGMNATQAASSYLANSATSFEFKNADNEDISSGFVYKFDSKGEIYFETSHESATVTVLAATKSSTSGNGIKLDGSLGSNTPPTTVTTTYTETFTNIEPGNHTLARNSSENAVVYVKVVETGALVQKYNATFANGGHGTAPSDKESVTEVILPTIGENFYLNTGWIADKDVTVDEATVTAGQTIACGKTAQLSDNTTFTAQWTETEFPYVEGITFPEALPTNALDMATQTIYTPSKGYVVLDPRADIANGGATKNFWMTSLNSNGSGIKWTSPEGSLFPSSSSDNTTCLAIRTNYTYAVKFTGTIEFQTMINPRKDGYYAHALLMDYTTKTVIDDQSIGVASESSKVAALTSNHVKTFSNLDPLHTYVVLFYSTCDNTNGAIYGIALRGTKETVTTNVAGWTSYTPSYNVTLEDGAKAYIVTAVDNANKKVTVREVTTMKSGEGYFIKGTESTEYTATYTSADADDVTGNMLVGCTSEQTLSAGETPYKYFLGTKAGTAGLYYVGETAITIPAGKCYLQTEITESPMTLSISFEDDATAITNVNANENANAEAPVKVIKNGKLYIGNYNVAGQQVK